MKLLLKIAVIVVYLITQWNASESLAASDAEQTTRYNEAGALYREGQFASALHIYEELIRSGITNPDLFYNASNAAYRIGSLGKAILYIERALKLAPSDRDALANLAYLNSIKKDQESEDSNVVLTFLTQRYNSVNVNSAAIWSGVMFVCATLIATGALFVRKWKRMALIAVSSLCGLICIISTVIWLHKVHYNSTVVEAVIMTEEALAYSGPGDENTHIFTIHEGTKVTIERAQDSWNLIRLNSGAGGWIKNDSMERI